FQGMFAEYEKAQLMERYRRGKTYRAASSVCAAAPVRRVPTRPRLVRHPRRWRPSTTDGPTHMRA
ncbi:hypothetical protein, partial [Streptomyces sp. NPDC005407]|uniref:hypothetical protein n=1 Tax=Streptomyces sp. NPDC005407 TaxID=3155340 RepID=UPI0033AEA4F0